MGYAVTGTAHSSYCSRPMPPSSSFMMDGLLLPSLLREAQHQTGIYGTACSSVPIQANSAFLAYGLSRLLPAEDTRSGKAQRGLQETGASTNPTELTARQHLLIRSAVTNPTTFLPRFLSILCYRWTMPDRQCRSLHQKRLSWGSDAQLSVICWAWADLPRTPTRACAR